jgi:glycosyltransferase involved in cell wall biosynthesis
MRIAFISYEYPPDTGTGGIGTYVRQAAHMLRRRGHHVEVFAATDSARYQEDDEGIVVHRVQEHDRKQFAHSVREVFAKAHTAERFDIVETAEYGADGREVIKQFPRLPLVVKLHTPTFLINRLNAGAQSVLSKARFALGALRRGAFRRLRPNYDYRFDEEYAFARLADVLLSPSRDLIQIVAREWHLAPDAIQHLPNVFDPALAFLAIDARPPEDDVVVAFVGRLERRKGVLDLMHAIPRVLAREPRVRFVFAGAASYSPNRALDMRQYIERQLSAYRDRLTFLGFVPYERLPAVLANSDICVFPSVWENFPNVCLEAMAAARAVIGSSAGGMADMFDGSRCGLLTPPNDARSLAEAVLRLATNRDLRIELGQKARKKVSRAYTPDVIGPLQEDVYHTAVRRCAERTTNAQAPSA